MDLAIPPNISLPRVARLSQFITIQALFRVHPGRREIVDRLLVELDRHASDEPLVLFHEASFHSDNLALRIAYPSAVSLLDHLAGSSDGFERLLSETDLIRMEVHGPEAELSQLRGPLGVFQPDWFVLAAPRS